MNTERTERISTMGMDEYPNVIPIENYIFNAIMRGDRVPNENEHDRLLLRRIERIQENNILNRYFQMQKFVGYIAIIAGIAMNFIPLTLTIKLPIMVIVETYGFLCFCRRRFTYNKDVNYIYRMKSRRRF